MGIKSKHRFALPFEAAFEKGALLVGEVEPVFTYDSRRRAYTTEQERDELTGQLKWKARLMDLDLDVKGKQSGLDLIFLADVRPVPVTQEITPNVRPIQLEGVTVEVRASVQGDFATMTFAYWATGIKGDTSGSKLPPMDVPASRPVRSDKSAADAKAVA
ncbi:MAG: hypothetical protein JWN03_1472 [Nocardia sp.]|uniref:hypothetical protein n=1 Tax=Nocardia sp. TaxID=1821 RepID=UPI002634769C|nr:hypothetical protein [Nocardia sp.]MCU1641197.1 hypothetical protein [Nocardia sp.]